MNETAPYRPRLIERVKQGALYELGRSTYYVLSDPEAPANAGIVVGNAATIVIDSRLTPSLGEDLEGVARNLAAGGRRALYLVNTHYHGDHCFGNSAFAGMVGFASSDARRLLSDDSDWQRQIDSFVSRRPHLREELESMERLVPAVGVDSSVDIDLGGVTVRLETIGTAHSPGDLIVRVPSERVTYTGDLVYHQHWPVLKYGDHGIWMRALDHLLSLQDRFYVPGHGPGGGPEMIHTVQAAWRWLEEQAAEGVGPEQIEQTLATSDFASWLRRERIAEVVTKLRGAPS